MVRTTIGNRMKDYEAISKNFLMRRTPAIVRLDGKSFHSFTRGFDKPFDEDFMTAMQETMKYLCENIQGCVLGYTQSDEITLVLCDYQTLETDAWFDYNVQKMTSVSASMATFAFTSAFNKILREMRASNYTFFEDKIKMIGEKLEKGVFFDSRAFSLSKEEVCNCLIWRQQDATRNSIQAAGHAYFSQKELHGLNCNRIQEKLFSEAGINWNDYSVPEKRGTCCIKEDGKWVLDYNIPIFSQDRNYVNSRITFE